ncbi:hypothetical protein Cme02nite_55090 [Catellatospora methionotrophica]|uniref:Methylamine utilisation protein MauE domain-containing protein n=1 Tax=Catellatospora methionotrophica TaxID=121620 RepID=A0A8J3PHC3_9ACTN|nr:MauE/DoxX family redox-associated membrane protein [Catellatospora methionotrophica]GIG17177.1 hypothetical protein Cme02nite_55090 [Catellatospora methionotrophica]
MGELWTVGARCAIIVVFTVSVVGKVRTRAAFSEFTDSLYGFGQPTAAAARLLAAATVLAEAAIVGLTVLSATFRWGLLIAAGVLLVFVVAIVRALRRGLAPSCRCFGSGVSRMSRIHVVRNLLLTVIALTGLLTAAIGTRAALNPAGAGLAVCCGAMAAVVLIHLDDIAALFASEQTGTTRRRADHSS